MDAITSLLAALAGGPRQHDRLLKLSTALGPDVLVAEQLDGVESVDHGGFRFELTALCISAHLDLRELLGQPVLLELLTAESAHQRRPFHGHVTAFERVGSNGGLARYRLVIEPWLAFLRQRVDSFVFQDLSVVDIVESVFADYVGQGKLTPAWRWDLKDPSVYRKRSLLTQYEESDFAFVERLLAEEGIHYFIEHAGDAGSDSLGTHTLVLSDHNDVFADLGAVRFHRADATEKSDSVQVFSRQAHWLPQSLRRASWDHRTLDLRPVEAGGAPGAVAVLDDDLLHPYSYPDRATGERWVQRELEALQVGALTVEGQGTWRQLRPGASFELTQHGQGGRFACLRVHHRARNNLGADVIEAIEQSLGRATLPALPLPTALNPYAGDDACHPALTASTGRRDDDTARSGSEIAAYFYDNAFFGIPAAIPYRPARQTTQGTPLHPRPCVRGTQTAIVVSDGAPLGTDRDHRIQVQFPWQRGGNASNRLAHPAGDDNAPGTLGAWTWVRVATPWAGDNWGGVLLPRRGQEVVVSFLEGDIDRPVVIGAVYNGQGQPDAAHNQVAGGAANATGNAPAWFDGNEHASVFTGFKTQALAASQDGSGGYQQLRLDDTPGQGRAQASTTQHETTLTLGHLKGGTDNVRKSERGFGVELSTQASGALRAGAGLLITTESGRQQLDATLATQQLAQSEQLIQTLQDAAKHQSADLLGEAETLPVIEALQTVQETLQATQTGSAPGDGIGGGEGSAPGWSQPALIASSPDGIAAVTPADTVWVSGQQTTLTAEADLQWLTQGEAVIAVAGGIALYTHGAKAPDGKPNQERGIALHAAQGDVSARAHKQLARIAAQTSVTLASTQADISIASPTKHFLATAAGAYIRMEGGNIELGAPGTIEFKAAKKEWTGPQSASAEKLTLAAGKLKLCDFKMKKASARGGALVTS